MIRLYSFFACLLLSNAVYSAPLSYDRAVRKAQQGDWKEAQNRLQKLLVDSPDDVNILYDAGVASYNCKDFSQAHAYFMSSAHNAQSSQRTEQAYFNAANASVALKKLEMAIAEYEKALGYNQNNEYVRHNYEIVKKMLEQQKQQEQQDKQDDQKKDDQQQDNKDQDNKENSQDNNNKNDQKDSSGNDQEHEDNKKEDNKGQGQNDQNDGQPQQKQPGDGNQDQSDNQKKNQGQDSSDKTGRNQKGDDSKDARDSAERKNHEGSDERKQQKKDEQGNGEHDAKSKPKQADDTNKSQQESKHDGTSSQQDTQRDNKDTPLEPDGQDYGLEPWVAQMLKQQEDHDKQINKQLMEAKIRASGGKNGQNCW